MDSGSSTALLQKHCATKYAITEGDRISAREDFWNGVIFNVKDASSSTMGTSTFVYVNKVTVQGWLHVNGTSRSTMVKSDYEHNWIEWTWESATISGAGFEDFNLSVTYKSNPHRWLRTAGSRNVTIPAGC